MHRSTQESDMGTVIKTESLFLAFAMIAAGSTFAQRGDIIIPTSNDITVPAGAQICADRIYANNPGYGTLNLANASCICAGAAIVPVELLSLSASYHAGVVSLVWRTASETNCVAYEVQRESEQNAWDFIGSVQASGTSTQEHAYAFDDRLTPELQNSGILRYRLKQNDMDGSFEYSPVVEVAIDVVATELALHAAYPNPASDRLTVRYSLPDAMPSRIMVYSMTGQEIAAFEGGELSDRGGHILSLNTSSFTPGAYLLELVAGDARLVRQFVVRW